MSLIAAAGLLARTLVILWIPTQPVSDFWSYYHRGLNLAEHGRYEATPGQADASFPPLYPMLLAAAFFFFPGPKALIAAKAVNVFLGLASLLIGATLARRLWGDRAGIVAACFFAFLPRYLLMPCLIASENLFSPLILLLVLLALEGARTPKAWGLAAAGGLVLALAALTRTVAYYLGALWLLGALSAGKKIRTALAETLLVVTVQHAVMLPWALRNEARLGRFTFLNTAGGPAMFLGNNPNATGRWYDARADLERASPGITSRGVVAISDVSTALAWRWIRENPRRALSLYVKKFGIIFKETAIVADFAINGKSISPPLPPADALPGRHWLKDHSAKLARLLSAAAWLLLVLGALGCVALAARAWRTRSPGDLVPSLLFPAAALYVPATSALIAVNGRYRWPVEDVLVPVASLFAVMALSGRVRAVHPDATARPAVSGKSRGLRQLEAVMFLFAGDPMAHQVFPARRSGPPPFGSSSSETWRGFRPEAAVGPPPRVWRWPASRRRYGPLNCGSRRRPSVAARICGD